MPGLLLFGGKMRPSGSGEGSREFRALRRLGELIFQAINELQGYRGGTGLNWKQGNAIAEDWGNFRRGESLPDERRDDLADGLLLEVGAFAGVSEDVVVDVEGGPHNLASATIMRLMRNAMQGGMGVKRGKLVGRVAEANCARFWERAQICCSHVPEAGHGAPGELLRTRRRRES